MATRKTRAAAGDEAFDPTLVNHPVDTVPLLLNADFDFVIVINLEILY